jgi:hypothetical protein
VTTPSTPVDDLAESTEHQRTAHGFESDSVELLSLALTILGTVSLLGTFLDVVWKQNETRDRIFGWDDSREVESAVATYLFRNDWCSMFAGSVLACVVFGILVLWFRTRTHSASVRSVLAFVGGLYVFAGVAHGILSSREGWKLATQTTSRAWLIGAIVVVIAMALSCAAWAMLAVRRGRAAR